MTVLSVVVPVLTAVDAAFGPCVVFAPPTRPPSDPLFGNERPVVLPSVGDTLPLNPHWMPSARA